MLLCFQFPCPSPEMCSQQNPTPVPYKTEQFPPPDVASHNGFSSQIPQNGTIPNPNGFKAGRSPNQTQRRPYSPDYSTDSSYFDNEFNNRNNSGGGRGRSPGFGSGRGSRGSGKSHRSRSKSSERKSYSSSNEKKGNKCTGKKHFFFLRW